MSDNLSLKYLFDKHNMNAKQERWLSFLREYDFEIKHIKGKENKEAATFRRNANMNYISLNDKFEDGVKMEKDYQNLREKVIENESENIKQILVLMKKV